MTAYLKSSAKQLLSRARRMPRRVLEMLRIAGLMGARNVSDRISLSVGKLRILWEAAGQSAAATS